MKKLTVKEVANIMDVTPRHVRRLIKKGELDFIQERSEKTGRLEYYLKEEDLPKFVRKNEKKNFLKQKEKISKENLEKSTYSDFTQEERKEIDIWIEILNYWREQRVIYENLEVADNDITGAIRLKLKADGIKNITVSPQILNRKYNALINNDLAGLIDKRGGHNKGQSIIDDTTWSGFLNYYLDDNKIPFREAYRMTRYWVEECYPELLEGFASESTFKRRYKNDINMSVEIYKREGVKALLDKCMPYIDRLYDDLKANDVWIADNHTLDIQSIDDETETIHRLSLTGFMDAKSGVLVGYNITDNPSMNSTIFALRNGILKYGKPAAILADNGSEFLTYDFAGRKVRKKSEDKIIKEYSTILGRLGIEFKTAKVKNAKAKNIERLFLDIKNHISKSFSTYTGGNITERPESLRKQIKNGNIPTDSKLREIFDLLIEQENMREYGGKDKKNYVGMSKIAVWNESIKETKQVLIPERDLDLYLMRVKNLQKVGRMGIYINIAGEKLWYNCEDYWKYIGKSVMVRYDPTDLRQVRVYDEEDRYMANWNLEQELYLSFYETDEQKIEDANKKLASITKAVKAYAKDMLELSPDKKIDILDLKIKKARKERGEYVIEQSDVIQMQQIQEERAFRELKTGTDNKAVVIDINRMNKNRQKRI